MKTKQKTKLIHLVINLRHKLKTSGVIVGRRRMSPIEFYNAINGTPEEYRFVRDRFETMHEAWKACADVRMLYRMTIGIRYGEQKHEIGKILQMIHRDHFLSREQEFDRWIKLIIGNPFPATGVNKQIIKS